MADTVKTQVMKAIEAVLRAGVPELKTVERRDPIGVDLDRPDLPILFLFEEEETSRKGNRLRYGVIRIMMAVWVRLLPKTRDPGFQAFYDLADTIAGRVWVLLQTSPALKGLVLTAKEDLRRPAIGNEALGELVLRYSITYGHAAGDAFTTQI